MVGDGCLGQADFFGQVADIQLAAFFKLFEYLLPDGVADGFEERWKTESAHNLSIFFDDCFNVITNVCRVKFCSRRAVGCKLSGSTFFRDRNLLISIISARS